MRCVAPVRAYRLESGTVVFAERGAIAENLLVRCGQCIGCRISRVQDWSVRCIHESKCHAANCFVTLTYDDEHLSSLSLNYRHFQLFMKRLRKTGRKARFFMCGEYGEQFNRPHFHACLFNVDFPDKVILRANVDVSLTLYSSKELSSLWPYGFSSIGDVTVASAAYVASYVIKKRNGQGAEDHYWCVDERTGELVQLEPELSHMSLKPGIGANWYAKYGVSDTRVRDSVISGGRRFVLPRYYDKLFESTDLEEFEWTKFERQVKAAAYAADSTPARLEAQAVVAKARLGLKRREL